MTPAAIRTQHLGKRFGPTTALEDLTLDVAEGEIFGFLGPNGAGKSTTIRLLLGIIRPTSGTGWLGGVPIADVLGAHRLVGYVPGDVALWPQLTGLETLELLGAMAGGVDETYRDELDRFDLDLSRRVRAYSKGNRQKVALVAAFMGHARILLLDEPTAGLDPLMEAEFQALVRETAADGRTVFLSSHLLDEVEDLCDRVAILRAGRLVEVATLSDLRALSTTIFEAELVGVTPSFDDLPEVVAVEPMRGGVRLSVTGEPAEVLRRLAAAGVRRLHSRAPSLEQIFLTYYDTRSTQRRAVAAAHGRLDRGQAQSRDPVR
ncbi:MAG TPA: ABC transporter ATP-binding protein [Propionibacteriaceae bacterium]|nr:ABC transporter ATP-binding protein [Propionibacteriaceae bacterium]